MIRLRKENVLSRLKLIRQEAEVRDPQDGSPKVEAQILSLLIDYINDSDIATAIDQIPF
jgi:hypothetical protein